MPHHQTRPGLMEHEHQCRTEGRSPRHAHQIPPHHDQRRKRHQHPRNLARQQSPEWMLRRHPLPPTRTTLSAAPPRKHSAPLPTGSTARPKPSRRACGTPRNRLRLPHRTPPPPSAVNLNFHEALAARRSDLLRSHLRPASARVLRPGHRRSHLRNECQQRQKALERQSHEPNAEPEHAHHELADDRSSTRPA